MENLNTSIIFHEQHGKTFKEAYNSAYRSVVAREKEKKANYQLKDWEFLSANLSNFMPEISENEYENIYYKLLTNHLLSGSSFKYADLDSMKYMPIHGDVSFLEPEAHKKTKIFCTYHLGGYRAIFAILLNANYPIALVVDKKTLSQQKETIEAVNNQLNEHNQTQTKVKILEAESPEIGKNMAMAVLSGYSVLIFLDGNTGVGGLYNRSEKQIKLQFLKQDIYSRTGIAMLSYAMRIPIVPIISYYETIQGVELPLYFADKPIVPNTKEVSQADYVSATTLKLYGFLEKYLSKYPDQWESWFYFHKFISISNDKEINQLSINEKLPETLQFHNQRFGIFKMNDEGFLFDKKAYKAFPMDLSDFEKLAKIKSVKENTTAHLVQNFENEWITKLFQDNILV
jgi:lauroyl/myristoyl acyltransferase